jgi:hypothetical protein
MASPVTRQARLKTIFWTVLAFNLVEYGAVAFFLASIWNSLVTVDNGPAGMLIVLLLIALPGLLLYQALFVVNNYFPARAFSGTLRAFLTVLCISQILSSLFLIITDLNTLFVELPAETRNGTNDIPMLPAYLVAISLLLTSLANGTAAVVLWRTVGTIRRNYRKGAWESFEAS